MPYGRLPYVLALVPILVACSDDGGSPSDRSASMAGRVAIAGQSSAVAGASIAVDQIRVDDASGAVREHIGDTVSDAEGRFQLDGFGERNGLFLVTSSGGSFRDLVSGERVELDASDQIRTLITLDLFEERTDALVSGVGHLTEVLARQRLAAGLHADLYEAREFAATHVDAHFGSVTWQRIDPARLDMPAASATDPVRAALVAEAWAILTNGIATAAGASPQEVNVFSLMKAWATDLAAPPFDGQDNNDNAHGSGVQLGECPAVPDGCVPAPPAPACSLGSCRTECDLYSGTPRAALSGALLKLVRSDYNQTGLLDTAILPLARTMAENTDEVLFTGCVDNLDRSAPSIFFESPTPADGAFVRGTISVRVRAVDDIDTDPDLVLLNGLVDGDGDDSNAVATAEVSSTADGPLTVQARATDAAGNSSMTSRTLNFDDTDPQITLAPTGFYVQGADWWTGNPTPVVGGTITEANLDVVNVYADNVLLGGASVTASSWSFTLPAGAVPGLAGIEVRIEARDRAGGMATVTQRIRYDATPPVIALPDSRVRDESADTITFSQVLDPIFGVPVYNPTHDHSGAEVTLGPLTVCDLTGAPRVTKYAYLLDEFPAYASETGGNGPGGRNPLRWAMTISDDGVGVDFATVAYRVRDVAANTFPLDWTPLTGTGSYTVNLFRAAASGPSIALLGSKEGLFEIQFRGRDRLGRDALLTTRCWNHVLLAAPLVFGFPSVTMPGGPSAPTNGPAGSGKYGLTAANFSLADASSPFDPISMLMNAPTPGVPSGVGLMQFPVYNPTNETVYLSVDLVKPTTGVAAKRYYQNRWTYNESTVNVTCGTDPGGGPDITTPGCEPVSNPGSGTTTIFPSMGVDTTPIPPSNYSVRVWEEPVGSGSYAELTQCSGCSTTAPAPDTATRTRVTVMIPPRGSPIGAPPPRKFWIVPVLVGPIGLQPSAPGPYTEFSAGGANMSGAVDETRAGCVEYTQNPPYRCTRRRTYRRFRATWHAEVTGIAATRAFVRTSWTTSGDGVPTYVTPSDGRREADIVNWISDEPTQPN